MRAEQRRPGVSIIVHLQAIGREVEACLQALSEQSLQECQFIIIHDGKSGDALYFANDFAAHDARFEIYLQMGIGGGAAYNYGLQFVQAPIVGFLNGFDVVDVQFCEALVTALEQTQADVATCDFYNCRWEQPLTPYQAMGSGIFNKLYRREFINQESLTFREQIWYAELLFNYQALLTEPKLTTVDSVGVKQHHQVLQKEPTTDHCYDIFPVLTTIYEQANTVQRQQLLPVFLEAIFLETIPKFWSYGAKDLGTIKRQTDYSLNFLATHFPNWREELGTLTLGAEFSDIYGRLPQMKIQQLEGWKALPIIAMFQFRHLWKRSNK